VLVFASVLVHQDLSITNEPDTPASLGRPTRRWTERSRHKPRGSDPVSMSMTNAGRRPAPLLMREMRFMIPRPRRDHEGTRVGIAVEGAVGLSTD
jgi:hypothetical protein